MEEEGGLEEKSQRKHHLCRGIWVSKNRWPVSQIKGKVHSKPKKQNMQRSKGVQEESVPDTLLEALSRGHGACWIRGRKVGGGKARGKVKKA